MRIGELSRLTGISTRMLRHYDRIGLLVPGSRAANGYREYGPDDVERLFRVEGLRTLGLDLAAIRDTLDGDPTAGSAVDHLGELIDATRERIAREQTLLTRLLALRDGDATTWRDVLDLVALLQRLQSTDASNRQRVALADADAMPTAAIVEAVLGEEDPNVAGALQWALARSRGDALPALARALGSADGQVRRRAISAICELDAEATGPVLRDALAHADRVVRERAALTLGRRGDASAVPVMLGMVLTGSSDVDAADALGTIGRAHGTSDQIARRLVDLLGRAGDHPEGAGSDRSGTAEERRRLVQALAELPGAVASGALEDLRADADRAVSLTALAVLAARSRAGRSCRRPRRVAVEVVGVGSPTVPPRL